MNNKLVIMIVILSIITIMIIAVIAMIIACHLLAAARRSRPKRLRQRILAGVISVSAGRLGREITHYYYYYYYYYFSY